MIDQELFKGTAEYYAKYRPGYTSEFFDYIIRYFNLNGEGRLLDVGCGTGQLAIPLAKNFDEVVGLDPEQEMLDEAKVQAEKAGVGNISWLCARAEDLSENSGVFRLTTVGAALHWMDQKVVLQKIYDHAEVGGGLAVVYDSAGSWATKDESTDPWQKKVREILKKYLGEQRRAGNTFYQKPEEEFDDLVEQSPFGACEVWAHEYTKEWSVESIMGFLYSTSFASRRLLGERVGEFESEIKTELSKIEPSGSFVEQAEIEAIVAKK